MAGKLLLGFCAGLAALCLLGGESVRADQEEKCPGVAVKCGKDACGEKACGAKACGAKVCGEKAACPCRVAQAKCGKACDPQAAGCRETSTVAKVDARGCKSCPAACGDACPSLESEVAEMIVIATQPSCDNCACGKSCGCDADSKCRPECRCDGQESFRWVISGLSLPSLCESCPTDAKQACEQVGDALFAGQCPLGDCPVLGEWTAQCPVLKGMFASKCEDGACPADAVGCLPPPPPQHAGMPPMPPMPHAGPHPHLPGFVPPHHPPFPPMPNPPAVFPEAMARLMQENARLKAMAEAQEKLASERERFMEAMVEARLENARLEARLELVRERDEMLEQLVETMVDKARLEGHAQMIEERAALLVELAQQKRLEPPAVAAPESLRQRLVEAQRENERLQATIVELREQLEDAAARTANRETTVDLEAELNAPR